MSVYPKYLFHYTSIENLCLMLRNKSIRFTRLDKVNDPEEGLTRNFPFAKFFIYVSCWTSEEQESLPLWKFYSANMKGVRIRMPINMFKGRKKPECKTTSFPIIHIDQNINIHRHNSMYQSLLTGPSKVKYLKNPLNKNSCFVNKNGDIVDVKLIHVGLSKYKHWKFEKEWRYRVIGMPFEGNWSKDYYANFMEMPISEYLGLHLDPSIFPEMIVQLGPKAKRAESIIVEMLLKEYAPGAKLCNSSCKIRE